jgi:hypothetical protein
LHFEKFVPEYSEENKVSKYLGKGSAGMGKRIFTVIVVSLLVLSVTSAARADWQESLRLFGPETPLNRMVSQFYNVEPVIVTTVAQNANITDDVITTFEIARLANANPIMINEMRKRGLNWIDIMRELNVNPARLFVNAGDYQVPQVYQRGYRQLRDFQAGRTARIMLYDTEVRHLANTRFLVQTFDLSPSFVMANRTRGVGYIRMMREQVGTMRGFN